MSTDSWIKDNEYLQSLLSLLPPSCMVVPIRDLGNIAFDTHTSHSPMTEIALNEDCYMANSVYNRMFKQIGNLNVDKVRDHSLDASAYRPRSPSMSSTEDKKKYHVQVKKVSNRMDKDEPVILSNSTIQLEYETPRSQHSQTSKATRVTNAMCQQCVLNKITALNQPAGNNVVNIQLSYDINQALEPES